MNEKSRWVAGVWRHPAANARRALGVEKVAAQGRTSGVTKPRPAGLAAGESAGLGRRPSRCAYSSSSISTVPPPIGGVVNIARIGSA